MDAHVRTPEPLSRNGILSNNWRMWKEDFIIFMKASGFIKNAEPERAYLLLNLIGEVGREAYQKFTFENDLDKEDMDVLLQKFEEQFDPPKSDAQKRYYFFTRTRKNNESLENFITGLKELARNCNFGDLTDGLVRDKVVLDTKDRILRRKLLDERELDLKKLLEIYNNHEITNETIKEISNKTKQQPETSTSNYQRNAEKPNCWRCGRTHPRGNCPAWGKTCTKCNDKHHFPQCCKNFIRKGDGPSANQSKVNENKNTNYQWQKPDTKYSHPFGPLKTDINNKQVNEVKNIYPQLQKSNANDSHPLGPLKTDINNKQVNEVKSFNPQLQKSNTKDPHPSNQLKKNTDSKQTVTNNTPTPVVSNMRHDIQFTPRKTKNKDNQDCVIS